MSERLFLELADEQLDERLRAIRARNAADFAGWTHGAHTPGEQAMEDRDYLLSLLQSERDSGNAASK